MPSEKAARSIIEIIKAISSLFLIGLMAAAFEARASDGRPHRSATAVLPLPDKPSLAVLPFINLGGDPKGDYFVDGITDSLIADLSTVSGLFVIARNSSFQFRGATSEASKISSELGVRWLLEGSVQKGEDRLRVTVQLIDGRMNNLLRHHS